MRILTLNVNGLRAAARKGFLEWFPQTQADVLCLQETRTHADQRGAELCCPEGYGCYYHDARRRGYSGVALYCRQRPEEIVEGLGWPSVDVEGRYLEARFNGLSVVSLYVPSGSSSDVRQAVKFEFLKRFMRFLKRIRKQPREYVICGDWNIAHKAIDLKNWRSNQKNSGFLPEERAWMDELFGRAGFVDAFRVVDPLPERYTWWSNRGQAWAKNVGWRIDYQVITPGLRDRVRAAEIYTAQRFSDHAPLIIDYDL